MHYEYKESSQDRGSMSSQAQWFIQPPDHWRGNEDSRGCRGTETP